GEGIAGRNGVRRAGVHVDPKQFPEQYRRVLRAVSRIALRASIAEACVEEAVGAEDDVAAVVVRVGLLESQDHLLAGRVESRAAVLADEARDGGAQIRRAGRAVGGVAEENLMIGLPAGMKRHAQQARLTAA